MGGRGLASYHLLYISISCANPPGPAPLGSGLTNGLGLCQSQPLILRLFLKKLVGPKQDRWATMPSAPGATT